MKIIQTPVYLINELTDEKAKQKALNWVLEGVMSFDWWDSVYDDAKNIGAEITHFDIYRRDIGFRLNWDAISAALAIRANHGEACDTYQAAQALISKHDEYHGVNGKISLLTRELSDLRDGFTNERDSLQAQIEELEEEWEEIEKDFTQQLAQCYLQNLRTECEYMESEEYLTEHALANEYTFTAEGVRWG